MLTLLIVLFCLIELKLLTIGEEGYV